MNAGWLHACKSVLQQQLNSRAMILFWSWRGSLVFFGSAALTAQTHTSLASQAEVQPDAFYLNLYFPDPAILMMAASVDLWRVDRIIGVDGIGTVADSPTTRRRAAR